MVYVDHEANRYGRMIMCHMLADSLTELHDMARQLGLKPEWFQNHKTPHYDICLAKRAQAIRLGAKEIDRSKVVALIRKFRQRESSVRKKKLTPRQLEVISKMEAGWSLCRSEGCLYPSVSLQKNGCGRGGESQRINYNTFLALVRRDLVVLQEQGYPASSWKLP